METISIGIACTLLGAVIGVATYNRNRDKDIKNDSKEEAIVTTKLDYISRGIDDIKLDMKAHDRRITDINDRLIRVEESSKSAHHRLDTIEGKEE